ncbi:unnamed protein product [Trichogramma brassicae]|uniref:Uncharacterized protein n=1 Tax=Trichogramma brassicae TaxID=86971 RepID=A0A6H5IF07_9HYME|nr:unnamed protein product [Trichogramma brassicae]
MHYPSERLYRASRASNILVAQRTRARPPRICLPVLHRYRVVVYRPYIATSVPSALRASGSYFMHIVYSTNSDSQKRSPAAQRLHYYVYTYELARRAIYIPASTAYIYSHTQVSHRSALGCVRVRAATAAQPFTPATHIRSKSLIKIRLLRTMGESRNRYLRRDYYSSTRMMGGCADCVALRGNLLRFPRFTQIEIDANSRGCRNEINTYFSVYSLCELLDQLE